MYSRSLAIICLLICVFYSAHGQQDYFHQEFAIANENDVYTLKNSDRYYSNGILLHFRFLPDSSSWLGKRRRLNNKRIVDIELSQKFYTPMNLTLTDIEDFDRPYAGWLYAGLTLSDFYGSNQRLEYGLELGTTGRPSGAEAFQTWYHATVGFPRPRGWGFQIASELALNLKAKYQRQWNLFPGKLDLVTTTSAMLGSAFTNVVQSADLRWGRLQPLNQSGFANAMIGDRIGEFRNHFYLFTGYGYQWTVHDITIQGSLWRDNSVHTEEVFSNVRHFRVGWAASSANTTFRMTYHWLSEEVKGAQNHDYVGFELLLRFKPQK